MAVFSYLAAGSGSLNVGDALDPTGNILAATTSLVTLEGYDGSEVSYLGNSYTFNVDGFPTGGTVTSIEHRSSGGTLLSSVTGLNLSLVAVANALTFNGLAGDIAWLHLITENSPPPVQTPTSTEVIYENTDGSFTRLQGTGFVVDPLTGNFTAGTVTSIDHLNAAMTEIDTVSGISVNLVDLLAYFEDPLDALGALVLSGDDTITSADTDGIEAGGFGGNDTITTSSGNDTLEGGAGNDTLTGNGGNDLFVFDSEDVDLGNDTITDFTVGQDYIRLVRSDGINEFSDVSSADVGGDAVVTLSEGTFTLTGVDVAELRAWDFEIESVNFKRGWTDVYNPYGRIVEATGTKYTIVNTDTTLTTFTGTGFTYGGDGRPTAGNITSMQRTDAFENVQVTVTGNLATFGALNSGVWAPIASLQASIGESWLQVIALDVESVSATAITIVNSDGTKSTINGAGLTIGTGTFGGTVSSVQHFQADGTTLIKELTGLSLDLGLVVAAIDDRQTDSVSVNLFFNTLLAGNNTWTAADNGADTSFMIGSTGNDTYNLTSDFDTVDYSDVSGPVHVDLTAQTVAGPGFIDQLNGVHNVQSGDGDATLIGSVIGDFLEGGDGSDSISGGNGDDFLVGDQIDEPEGDGDDAIDGGAGNDMIDAGGGNDTLDGGAGNDTLLGGAGNDFLFGGDGDDSIDPGTNDGSGDIIVTGAGDDLVDFSGASGASFYVVNYSAEMSAIQLDWNSDGTGTVVTTGGTDSFTGLTAVDGTVGGLQFLGGSGNDLIDVDLGSTDEFVQIRGGAGDDSIIGGSGFDRLDYRSAGSGVTVTLTGQGTGTASDGDGGTDTFSAIDEVRGSDFSDTFYGGSGDDRFILRVGNDSVEGGAGTDLVRFDRSGMGAVDVDLQAGTATGTLNGVAFSHTLSGIEQVRGSRTEGDLLQGSGADELLLGRGGDDSLVGRGGNDTLNGENGNDTLDGGAGADSIDGGAGIDTVSYAGSAVGVRVDLRNGSPEQFGDAEGDVLSGIENFVGSDFDDFFAVSNTTSVENTMTGGAGNDILSAFSGNDTLFGGVGEDRLRGGDGIDVLYGGDDDDRVEGNAGNDIMYGGDGDDIMTGGNDDDQMFGGADNDTYVIKQAGDTVIEFVGEGIDLVRSSRDYVLGANVENLLLTGTTADEGTGNALDNILDAGSKGATLTGLGGDDTLLGSNNADTLDGGTGNDDLVGNDANDRLYGGDGNDTLDGGDDNDRLEGDAGNDTLEGGNGTDVLIGGADQDFYYGGAGADRFRFDDGHFAGTGGGTADRIFDFSQLDGDTIQLSQVDAIVGGGDDAFTFIGMSGFSNTAGELRYTQSLGNTFVRGDTDGDGAQDFVIRVDGTVNFIGADFFL